MKRKPTLSRAALLALTVAVAAAAVGGVVAAWATAASPTPATSGSPSPAGKKLVKIGWLESPDNMNPFIGWSNNVYEIYTNEYLRFVGIDTQTLGEDDTGVVKSYEVSPDGLTWTFTINEGITWHDGTPMTAEDVAFTYNYIVENDMPLLNTATTFVERAEVVDPSTVKIVCSKKKANLTRAWMIVLPKHIWSKIPPKEAATKFQNPPPVIGNGPWQVVDWKRNDFVRLVAYKNFYLGAPKIDEVLFIVYQNAESMVEDLKAGGLDAAYQIPSAQFGPLKTTAGIETEDYTWFNWDYIGINCYEGKSKGHPVLRDQRFRAALEHAVDRQQIVDVAYYSYAIPGYTFLPPGDFRDPDYSWQPPDGVRRDFDLAKANQLLDEAGYTDGDGDGVRDYKGKDIVLRLWANEASPASQRAAKLLAGWFRQVGVDTKLAVYDDGVYFDRVWNYEGDTFVPDFDVYIWSWDGYFDPGQTMDCFTTAQIEYNNELAWSNTEYDRLAEVQATTIDRDQRAEAMKQLQQVMYQDAAAIVLVHPYKLAAHRTDTWQGWQRANLGAGPSFCGQINPWAYYSLTPVAATTADGGTSSTLIVVVAVAVIVVAVAAYFLVRRGRRARLEEE